MHRHPKLSLWIREEDGSYKAEIEGVTLHVSWRPESPERPRGFLWRAEGASQAAGDADEVAEEIELAMVAAEDYALRSASARAQPDSAS